MAGTLRRLLASAAGFAWVSLTGKGGPDYGHRGVGPQLESFWQKPKNQFGKSQELGPTNRPDTRSRGQALCVSTLASLRLFVTVRIGASFVQSAINSREKVLM